jgi:hypothetical protein
MNTCIVLGAPPIARRVASAMRVRGLWCHSQATGDEITALSATCDTPVENGTWA